MEQFQRLGALDEDPQLRAFSRCHHDRGRRRQPHGAGAGDDQDTHGIGQGVEEGRLRPPEPPGTEGDRGDDEDHRDEDRCDSIGQALNRGLGALRFLHEPDDPGEDGLLAYPRGPEGEAARPVDGATHDRRSRPLLDRETLAGEHGFVHARGALDDLAVHRDALPGSHAEEIAHRHVGDRHIFFLPAPQDASGPGPKRHQRPDGLRGPAPRAGLEPPAEDEEGHEQRGRLVIRHGPRGHEALGPEGHRHAEAIRRAGADGHEGVHAGGSVKQLLHEPSVELPADPELDRCGEGPEEPRIAQPARGPGEDLVHAADQHRDREGGSHEEPPLEEPVLPPAQRLLAILRFGRGRDLDGHRVPGRGHGLTQVGQRGPVARQLHGGSLGGQVHHGPAHAGNAQERPLHLVDARGAVHPLHRQIESHGLLVQTLS